MPEESDLVGAEYTFDQQKPLLVEPRQVFIGERRGALHSPVPLSTASAVQYRIFVSSHRDHRSMYSRSKRIQSSKLDIAFRPRTCHRHVIPGRMLNFRICQNSYRGSSFNPAGRGPTRLISPLNTL